MSGQNAGLPGVKTVREATAREVLLTDMGRVLLPGGRIVDGSQARDLGNSGDTDVLRGGTLLGKVNTSGLFAPAFVGATRAAYDSSASPTGIPVSAAVATEVQRRLGGTAGDVVVIGPGTATGKVLVHPVTLTGITVDGDSSVLLCGNVGADVIEGGLVGIADGSYVPVALLQAPWGVQVTDGDGNDVDVPAAGLLVGGVVDTAAVVNWPSNAALARWIKAQLRAHGGGWVFADDFGTGASTPDERTEAVTATDVASMTQSGVTSGVVCSKRWSATQTKALLDGTEQVLCAVGEGDLLLRVTLVTGTAAGAACTVTVGLDAEADGAAKDVDGLLKDADANAAGIYRSDNATYAGDYAATGYRRVAAAGNVLLQASTDQSGSAFAGELLLEYVPA